jgi:hypothetical protein
MKQLIHVAKELSGPLCLALIVPLLLMATTIYAGERMCVRMHMKHSDLFNIPISPWNYIILAILSLACLKGALHGFKLGVNLKVRPKNYILPLCALFLTALCCWVTMDMHHSKEFHQTRSLFMDLPVTEEMQTLSFLFFTICLYLSLIEIGEAGIVYPKKTENNQTPTE